MKVAIFMCKFVGIIVVICSNFLFFSSAWGIDYPTKPINLIASASPGGPSDLSARILAEAASKGLGVPFIVINKIYRDHTGENT